MKILYLPKITLHEISSHAHIIRELFSDGSENPPRNIENFNDVGIFKKMGFVYLSRDILEIQDTEQEDLETIGVIYIFNLGRERYYLII